MDYWTTVRYGVMRYKGHFQSPIPDLAVGEPCIVRSQRGTELGAVIAPVRKHSEHARSACAVAGEILRRASEDDLARHERDIRLGTHRERRICESRIEVHGLRMKLVGVERLHGGEKIVFYYLAPHRVDFRALVKDLAREFHCRIEMRQIGARDEARLLGGHGHCGRHLCCRSWIVDVQPVSMKMAKLQKTTLDPAKISGMCGRLLCCLRYENEVYTELRRGMPHRGSSVLTPQGSGVVEGQGILSHKVRVLLDTGGRSSFDAAEVEVVRGGSRRDDLESFCIVREGVRRISLTRRSGEVTRGGAHAGEPAARPEGSAEKPEGYAEEDFEKGQAKPARE